MKPNTKKMSYFETVMVPVFDLMCRRKKSWHLQETSFPQAWNFDLRNKKYFADWTSIWQEGLTSNTDPKEDSMPMMSFSNTAASSDCNCMSSRGKILSDIASYSFTGIGKGFLAANSTSLWSNGRDFLGWNAEFVSSRATYRQAKPSYYLLPLANSHNLSLCAWIDQII